MTAKLYSDGERNDIIAKLNTDREWNGMTVNQTLIEYEMK